jgi:cyclase
MGGHSPATSSVFIPEEGVIFASDIVINEPCPGLRDANLKEWIEALNFLEGLSAARVVPGHGAICGMGEVRLLKEYLTEILGMMEEMVRAGRRREDASTDRSFERFFWTDTTRGDYWIQQRKDTFRSGLERVYDEVVRSWNS